MALIRAANADKAYSDDGLVVLYRYDREALPDLEAYRTHGRRNRAMWY
ncbi:MAG: hypothetical protein OXJ54_14745 [Gemmatimonadetes bacterium]|nr:hypothetical protein [Candidatus Palauibacter rhopaloidicola]